MHVFENKKDAENKEDPVHIGNATVTIEIVRDQNKEDYLEDKEWKFEIKEKENCPGIFEQTVPPGKYLLKIQKDDYETVTKTCLLQKGLNCINIELFRERKCKLVIKVFNYEKLIKDIHSPVINADVVIYQNSSEILEQGITDNNGVLEYEVEKGEDFLTIVINKMGYFPIQRTFIRDKNMVINEEDQYYEEMSFFLVKKSFIYNEKYMVFTIYTIIKKENFSFEAIDINQKVVKDKYPISCINAQVIDGMLSLYIPCRDDVEMDNTQTQNNFETQNNMENMNTENNNIDNNNGNINNENNNNENNNNENNNLNNNENNNMNNNENNLENNNNNQENQNLENGDMTGNNEEMDENYNNSENQIQNMDRERKENFDYIMNLTFVINSEELLIHNYQNKGHIMNGLERYGCQIIIYTPKNTFYINSPIYCKEGYKFWNVGWVDLKNELFYQTNILLENTISRVEHLSL